MKFLSNLLRTSPLWGIALLSSLSSPAYAGGWEEAKLIWAGQSKLKDLQYSSSSVEGNLYTIREETTLIKERNGDGHDGSIGHPNLANLSWGHQYHNEQRPNMEVFSNVPAKGTSSVATSSAHAVIKWKRNNLPGTLTPDPDDNPPKFIYVKESVRISSYKTTLATHGLPAYENTPWPADFVSVTAQAGSRDLKISLDADKWQYSKNTDALGTSYIYNNSESKIRIRRYSITGDTLSLGSISFSGTAALGAGYERPADNVSGSLFIKCYYEAEPVNISFSATPVGKYSITKNTPLNKVYEAYTRWGARYSTDGQMKVEPFVSAQSDFALTAKKNDGQEALQNPIYQWKSSAATYIPIMPPAEANGNIDILMRRQLANYLFDSEYYHNNLLYGDSEVSLRPGVLPQWWERAVWMDRLAASTGEFPPDWDIHTSTPNKTLFWNNGNRIQNIPPTTVTVKATDSQGTVVNGKITINWHRPAQTVYDVTLMPVEWQIAPPEEQVGGNAGNYIYTLLSDEKLHSDLRHEAVVQAAWAVGTAGAGLAGGKVFRVVLSTPAGAQFLARLYAVKAAIAGSQVTAAEAATIGNNVGKVKVTVTELSEHGNAVETATNTQTVHLGAEPVNGGTADVRPLIPEGESTTRLLPGDGSIDSIGQEIPSAQTINPAPRPEVSPKEAEIWEELGLAEHLINCFVAGTPVLMADNSLKSIEQIKAGDMVASKEPGTGRLSAKKVVRTFRNVAPVILSLTLGNGEQLTTTPGHPFATTERGDFVFAGDLPLKAQLQEFDGNTAFLASETFLAQPTPTFNFEVEDFHTYFVGKSHIWVHNRSVEKAAARIIKNAKAEGGARMTVASHGHAMPQNLIDDTVMNPGNVYTTTDGKLMFWKDDRIVVVIGQGSNIGDVVSTYGNGGLKGPSGVSIFGGQATDPSPIVTEHMLINGLVQRSKGLYYPKATLVIPTPPST